MTRRDVIRALTIGGRAAIAAEFIVILSLILFGVLQRDMVINQHRGTDGYESFRSVLEGYQEHPTLYVLNSVLMLVVPSVIMLVVAWAWNLFMLSEGVHLMSQVATSVAVIGAALMIASFGVTALGLSLAADALDKGQIALSDAFTGYVVSFGLQLIAIATLYILYPALLCVAGWQKRLLPWWFMGAVVVFVMVNDVYLLFYRTEARVANVIGVAIVLFPFLAGTAMLLKAQELAYTTRGEQTPSTV